MNIIGLAGLCIDASSSLIKKNKVIAAIEERLKRIKHVSYSIRRPKESLETCLKIGKINYKDIDHMVISSSHIRNFSMSYLDLKNLLHLLLL